MNLLITEAVNSASYLIIHALRPYADKIVITLSGKNLFNKLLKHTIYSRYVNRRYFVPLASDDWLAGRIQPVNSEAEEIYIQRIEAICQREAIDTVYPSHDASVYILAKNKQRFAEKGILIVGPDYDKVLTPMNKYESTLAAERAGFPIPCTYLPERVEDLEAITAEIGPPWVIKPRFTLSSKGTHYATRHEELRQVWVETAKKRGRPLVQEFIPGDGRQNFYVIAGHDGEILSLMCPQTLRVGFRVSRNSTAAAIVSSQTPYWEQVEALVHELGWLGTITIQTKLDARDGKLKFMETNPRPGDGLWRRTESGINEPLMCLQLARGEVVEAVKTYPNGAILLDPISDAMRLPYEMLDWLVFKMRTDILGKQALDPLNAPLSPAESVRVYWRDYSNAQRKIFEPRSRYFLKDPVACTVWYLEVLKILIAKLAKLGQ